MLFRSPAGGAAATTAETVEPSGVVSARTATEQPAGRKGQQPGALTPYEEGRAAALERPNIDAYSSPYKEGTPEFDQWVNGMLDVKHPSSKPTAPAPTEVVSEEPAPATPAATPAAPRSAFARPELPADLETVHQKLGQKGAKLDQQEIGRAHV